MNWIKKNPAQLSLATAAVVLLAVAFTLYSNATGFSDGFQGGNTTPVEDNKIPPTDLKVVDDRIAALEKPAAWLPKKSSPFVSRKYLVREKDGNKTIEDPTMGGAALHSPVPNSYILSAGIDITLANVLTDDVDRDGFDLLSEYAGMDGVITTKLPDAETDSTDPIKPESHPPYHTRLYLVKIHKIPFRLVFRANDQDGRTRKWTLQINPLDRGGVTKFVEEGEIVPGTDWKFESFELKDTGDVDVSVANMVNQRNGQKLALIKNQVGNSPESFAQFGYSWIPFGGTPTRDFAKKKDDTFGLAPEPEKLYKVLEIRTDAVDVQMPSGEKKTFKETPPAK